MIIRKLNKMHHQQLWLSLLLISQLICSHFCMEQSNYELLENDSRYISYHDLMSTAKRFYDPEISWYSELLFDVARNQVIVGARDTLFRMSFDLEPLEQASWVATQSQIAMCQVKGQSDRLCHNYVRVLHSFGENGNHLYACGTNAFQPSCSWRQMENLNVSRFDDGVVKCPFHPQANSTSLLLSNGNLFVGTTTDFTGSDAAIIRTEVQPNAPEPNRFLRTKQYNNNWLNGPQFVGSFESGNFVYFLLRESAAEHMGDGKVIYSRIARVCKNDAGGDQFMRDNWTSFLKARLNCSLPGDYPYYFNEIQGMTYADSEQLLYATFTTAGTSIFGSAVCAYNLSAINGAFDGPFKYQEHSDAVWHTVNTPHRSQFQCAAAASSTGLGAQRYGYGHLLESSRYQLMDRSVQPIGGQPLYHSKLERYSKIALDVVQTRTEQVHVLYVASTQNHIKKLSIKYDHLNGKRTQACLVELWQADDTGMSALLQMAYLKFSESLYLGTDLALTRIPAQRCSRHVSQASCFNAMDPYCGWNEVVERCMPQQLEPQGQQYWQQPAVLVCPILNAQIDGGWSTWSGWSVCQQHDDPDSNCMCRQRVCNNPQPQHGGRNCEGIGMQVTNCTVHGGWTEWSAWSQCSQTCGIAVKTRRRTCGNPRPQYGGRTCVGSEHGEIYCSLLPPCPTPKKPPVDGGWGPYGEWSECSAPCGGGFRMRRRECNDPIPENGGLDCPGCSLDYEDCNMQSCTEVRKFSSWTPWLMSTHSNVPNGTQLERRFRYICRSTSADSGSVRISLYKEETRSCHSDGSCQRHNTEHNEAIETEPNEWGPCSVSCGIGVQQRRGGKHVQSRVCNLQPCENELDRDSSADNELLQHEWSCWSDWSACSVSCGLGVRHRTRKCLGGHERLCQGRAQEYQKCEMVPCEDFVGWSSWTPWGPCSPDGTRVRLRTCLQRNPTAQECRGAQLEKTACVPNECDRAEVEIASTHMTVMMIFGILVPVICIGITFYFTRRRFMAKEVEDLNRTNATMLSFDQTINQSTGNQYSSLPTKDFYDVRPKRQSSFRTPVKNSNTMAGGGTLTRNNMNHNNMPKVLAKTYNDCETGTLKRHSALNNCRSNIEDEKF